MPFVVGQTVRMRPGADIAPLLGEAVEETGTVGDVWTDDTGERISVVYEPAQIYAMGVPAGDFVAAAH